jgi:tRNA (guanine-N7-)-methyltransferase
MQMEAVKRTVPESLIHRVNSLLDPLDWTRIFAQPQPVEVELGSGDGSFLARYAQLHPDRNFFGVERLNGRMKKLDRKGRRAGLHNLKVSRIEAAYLVQYLLAPASTSAIHVYFPDPWPKRRHWKNRLINESFPASAVRCLVPGGRVYLRTDDLPYHEQMVAVFQTDARFVAVATPEELRAVVTDFEREFNAQGIPTRYASYELR